MREDKLPWDMIEEILSRVPPKSFVRFGTVCKRWNNLLNDKTFINNHKTTFQFVLSTKSKIYSVNVNNPEIEVRELTLDNIPVSDVPRNLVNYNEFLMCGSSVCNPWLKQTRLIESDLIPCFMRFEGIGYEKKNNYKIIAGIRLMEDYNNLLLKIYDLASDTWKEYKSIYGEPTWGQKTGNNFKLVDESVSLNGDLYCLASSLRMTNKDNLLIACFHFPMEKFVAFCNLPCVKNHPRRDALVLGCFKGDRLSLLKQCFATKHIEIWVTKNKISWDCREDDVVWMSFMQVSIPNFPDLVEIGPHPLQQQPSYFIDNDKRLFVCSWDKTGRACIYVVANNKLTSKTRLDSVVDPWPSHCTHTPSLVPVPPSREVARSTGKVRWSWGKGNSKKPQIKCDPKKYLGYF